MQHLRVLARTVARVAKRDSLGITSTTGSIKAFEKSLNLYRKASNPVTSGPIGRGSGLGDLRDYTHLAQLTTLSKGLPSPQDRQNSRAVSLAQQAQFSPAVTLGTSAQRRDPLATPRTALSRRRRFQCGPVPAAPLKKTGQTGPPN